MRQAFHIFRKDVRFLRWNIALSLALTAAFIYSRSTDRAELLRLPVTTLLVLSWYALAGAAIFKERPVGDSQFWITRPYRVFSLIAEKALFLFVFIHLPLLAADLFILAAQGFAPDAATLLWRQFGLAALVTAPAAALAAVTANFAAMAVASLGIVGVYLALVTTIDSMRKGGLFDEWVRATAIAACLLLAAAATVAYQYRRRRASIGIAIGAAGFTLAAVAASTPLAVPVVPADEPASLRSVHLVATPSGVINAIQLRIEGLPSGMRPDVDAVAVSYGEGVPWSSGWQPRWNPASLRWPFSWNTEDNPATINIYPVGVTRGGRAHVVVLLSVYGQVTTELAPPDGRPHTTEIGRCTVTLRRLYSCRNSHYPTRFAEFDGSPMKIDPGLYFDYLSAGPIVEWQLSVSGVEHGAPPGKLVTAPRIGKIRREIDTTLGARR